MIVQAPHSPVLQQSFVPLNSKVSRRKSSSEVDASALALIDLPLIVVLIERLIMLPPCRWRLSRFVSNLGGLELRRSSDDFPRCCADRRLDSTPPPPSPRLL